MRSATTAIFRFSTKAIRSRRFAACSTMRRWPTRHRWNLRGRESSRPRTRQSRPRRCSRSAQPGRETSIAQIYRLYQERMRAMNAMDFSDLQLQTWILFERFPEVLERWQRRAAQLLVDEYQDTNRVQYLIVKALAARSGNLCVVGDEDQSIYRWRGADIRNILDFERDYPARADFQARTELPLDQNDTGSGRRRHPQQHRAQGQKSVDRECRRRAGHLLHRRHRARRG